MREVLKDTISTEIQRHTQPLRVMIQNNSHNFAIGRTKTKNLSAHKIPVTIAVSLCFALYFLDQLPRFGRELGVRLAGAAEKER
jgi:hypothetical protein